MLQKCYSSLGSAPPDEIYRIDLLSLRHTLIKPAVLTQCHGQNLNVDVRESPQLFFVWTFTIQLTPGFLAFAHEVSRLLLESTAQKVLDIILTRQVVICSHSHMERLPVVHPAVLSKKIPYPHIIRVTSYLC